MGTDYQQIALENDLTLVPGRKYDINDHTIKLKKQANKTMVKFPSYNSARDDFTVSVISDKNKNKLDAVVDICNMGNTVHDVAYIRVVETKDEANMEFIMGEQLPAVQSGFKTLALLKIKGQIKPKDEASERRRYTECSCS